MSAKLTKKFLENVYIKKRLSTWAIEKKFGIPRSRVYAHLKRYGILTRSIAQSHIRHQRFDFSGDECEQAYLLGFTIGDLRVRMHNGARSETISIGCGSTKPAQIKLINNLFSKYGHVWISKPDKRGAVNLEAFVNRSFAFLLPGARDYLWCGEDKKKFFSFLAGFTDAEGSFYISSGKAFISWGNYDTKVLNFIRVGLAQYGIIPPQMNCDSLRGYLGTHGYRRNNNYCHVTCAKKDVVSQLISNLEPFILHSDKKRKLMFLKKNLEQRV